MTYFSSHTIEDFMKIFLQMPQKKNYMRLNQTEIKNIRIMSQLKMNKNKYKNKINIGYKIWID